MELGKEIINPDRDSEWSIEVSHVTKTFKVYKDRGYVLKDVILFANRRKYENRQVLKDISFRVKRGEAVGLIGHNGCGKSTTLKLLTRITAPDTGTIRMNGRVSSLIELGAGFHPDMSGRENIYINASIFGLTKEEIDEKLDDIISFSELQDYIDNPVRTYSSGMYTRLAFSVAINVNADILLIDEILSVGDANFQVKCFDKMCELKENGTTIIVVSHSLGQIEQLCDRCIWINEGKIVRDGFAKEVDMAYLDYMGEKRKKMTAEERAARGETQTTSENENVVIDAIHLLDGAGNRINKIETGEECSLRVHYAAKAFIPDVIFLITVIRKKDGILVYAAHTRNQIAFEHVLIQDEGEFSLHIDALNLLPSDYKVYASIENKAGAVLDHAEELCEFQVVSKTMDFGLVNMSREWIISGAKATTEKKVEE